MKFFLIHGAFGHPKENWLPWLRKKLEEQGHEVYVPSFPTPEGQNLENWLSVFEEYKDIVDEETMLIGHSIGPAFILSFLETIEVRVKGCILVAPFLDLLGNEEFDKINSSFVDKSFDWKKIRENCEQFYSLASDNDPYIPLNSAKNVASKLGVDTIVVEQAGHFNEAAGFTSFPLVLDIVSLILRQKKVVLENTNTGLVGLVSTPENANGKAIVLAHGFGGNKHESGRFDKNALALLEKGYAVVRFDFSGMGESLFSFKDINLSLLKDDLSRVMNYVKDQKFEKVGLVGFSFGGPVSLALSPQVDSLVLMGSFASDPYKIISGLFPDFNPQGDSVRKSSRGQDMIIGSQFWRDVKEYNLMENLKEISCPKYFLQGRDDESVPFTNSEEMHAVAKGVKEIKIIDGATHCFDEKLDEQIEAVVNWFEKTLK